MGFCLGKTVLHYNKPMRFAVTFAGRILRQPFQEKIESKEFMGYAFVSAFRGVYGAL